LAGQGLRLKIIYEVEDGPTFLMEVVGPTSTIQILNNLEEAMAFAVFYAY